VRPLRSSALALAAALVAGLSVAPSAAAPPSGSTPEAEEALAAVEALFDGSHARRTGPASRADGREATLLLRDLAVQLTALDPADQVRARGYLARPTDPDAAIVAFRAAATPPPLCGPHVCVHYEEGTRDAPPAKDADGNGRPDQVDRTAAVMERVWSAFVAAGYRSPLPDSGGGAQGPNSKLDVYLADIGKNFQYGLCYTNGPLVGRTAPVSCILDDDFEDFPGNPLGNLRVTAAHELFHAVQYAYDVLEDAWFLEGTAAWVEDELFTGVNDNRQYLADSQMALPHRPLDYSGEPDGSVSVSVYGNWIFWRYLTLRHPTASGGLPTLVRDVLERAGERPGDGHSYAMRALDQELAARGSSLTSRYAGFAEANRHPARHYDEGSAYLPSPVTDVFRLNKRQRRVPKVGVRLDHMANRTWQFRPGKGMRGWTLRLRVDMPRLGREPVALVSVVRKRGLRHRAITLDTSGAGHLVVPFATGKVRRVELTLVNASRRYTCDRGTQFSCSGLPLDDRRRSTFSARTSR
jgi:hypothetical protein